jgi:hypothetical protein
MRQPGFWKRGAEEQIEQMQAEIWSPDKYVVGGGY